MQFGAVNDICIAKKKDVILVACNANKLYFFNSVAECLHKKHINVSCHSISPNNISYDI